MKIIIVGGSGAGKKSGVITKIENDFVENCEINKKLTGANYEIEVFNGTRPENIKGGELVLWMPDISNDEEKQYPVKDKGAVLICSKVMREGYTLLDAVERIFKMHGNAVIAIHKEPEKPFKFELVDALGHIWCSTYDISVLCASIYQLCSWTNGSIRKSVPKIDETIVAALNNISLVDFMNINRELAYKSAAQCGNRYFGNFSTRCTKLFPSHRNDDMIVMSPRNVDKRTLTPKDMVAIINGAYVGDRKPSVDAPVQLEVYKEVPGVNYMIHGHAYVKDAPMTDAYFPCGDMREVPETLELLRDGNKAINLRHHGFLLATETLEEMVNLKDSLNFDKIYDF